MTTTPGLTRKHLPVRRGMFILLAAWSVLVGASLGWNVWLVHRSVIMQAIGEANGHFNKDTVYRRWAASHGGVYVPVTEQMRPSPYLAHIPERDITTPSGRKLTLVNPAYMTRQVYEFRPEQYGVRGHITSLKVLRPGNEPDTWERQALLAFRAGKSEVSSVQEISGESFLRFMRPFFVEPACLKCHGHQGYKVGDVRGGISVSVPLAGYYAQRRAQIASFMVGHFLLYLAGVAGLWWGARLLAARTEENDRAWLAIDLDRQRFRSLLELTRRQGDEGAILDFALEEAVRLTSSQVGYFHFYDEATRNIHPAFWSRNVREQCSVPGMARDYPLAKAGEWADCIRQRQSLIFNTYQPAPGGKGCPEGHFPITRHMSVPLVDGEAIVAIIGVGNKGTPYQEGDVTQLSLYANSAWEIIKNRRAKEEISSLCNEMEGRVTRRTEELSRKNEELGRSHQALQYLLEDVNEAKQKLEAANAKLKELDRLKSMFIAAMSHELRTPLNSIIGFSGILLQGMSGEINEEQRDQLGRVFRSGKHLLSLITDVIDIAKIESGRIVPYPENFDLHGLIDDAVGQVRQQAAEKGLAIELRLPQAPVAMHSDRKRLLQCLLNYLSNAVKFSERGTVTVEARLLEDAAGKLVEFAVRDTGIGIRTADQGLLFGSFVRLESHLKTTTPGTGLGLYLTRKLATEVLAGEVGMESREGEGSRFWLKVPVVLEVAAAQEAS